MLIPALNERIAFCFAFPSPTHAGITGPAPWLPFEKKSEMYQGERFNSISNLIGAVAALAGLVIAVVVAARQGDHWKIVSFSVYGTALFFLYTVSTLYHSLHGKAKQVFRKLDHYSIYFLIAGTYTPLPWSPCAGAGAGPSSVLSGGCRSWEFFSRPCPRGKTGCSQWSFTWRWAGC